MEDVSRAPSEPAKRKLVRWSMIAGISGVYLFISVFAISFAARIVQEYLVTTPDTWTTLPGFGELWWPAFSIYAHWWGGCMILLVGLVQLFPFTRRPYMIVHRVLGTIYITGGLLTSLGGLTFIFTHGCIGGLNMDIAFATSGLLVFVFTVMTYYHARTHNVTAHRDYAIRLWGQGIASLLYRVWYLLLNVTVGYETRAFSDFRRPVDEFLDWWFFVPNLIVTELVVIWLHRQDAKRALQAAASTHATPLLP